MNVARRVSLAAAAGLLAVAVTLGWTSERSPASRDALRQMDAATAFFDSTIVLARAAQPTGARGDELAIALGYLERLRIGLGSPFRLTAEAVNDPRLGAAMRSRVAWALLGRLHRGDAYAVDAVALDGAGPWGVDGQGATGSAHVALIQHAIASSSDPRAGELAVRLAYVIEAAKGTLAPSTASIAAQTAALLRDRAMAIDDLRNLLSSATDDDTDVLSLLAARRASRSLGVEAPTLAPLSARLQTEAMEAVPGLVRALDTLDRAAVPVPGSVPSQPVMGVHFANRLAEVGKARPPVPQILVTARARARGPISATNEETLTSMAVMASAATTDSVRRALALTMLASAVAVRPLAQEEPWFPGNAGPDQADLAAEFGLAGVSFGRGVPAAWRPYYLRQLQTSLRDMQTVFPASSFNGLHVRFGVDALRDSALAMHDPRDRTLQLPIATAGGTVAHELSHDLDWQASRRLYADGTGYSTDRAMRDRRGTLAASVRGLTDVRSTRTYAGAAPVERPAELFARGTDWYVASALAQLGRSNGFLSAIQDGVLAGYAAGAPTALGAAGTASIVSAIGAITYVPDSSLAVFASQWSDPAVVDPALLVRRVLEAQVSWRATSQAGNATGGVEMLPLIHACSGVHTANARARERLLMLAVDARARGMALRRAQYRPSSMRSGTAQSVLGVAPWSSVAGDRLVDALRSAIIADLGGALVDQGVLPVVPAIFRSSASNCATIAH